MADKKKKPNWLKIQTEYETVGTSYAKLSKKYDVPKRTIEYRASKEKWVKQREETCGEIVSKLRQKTVEKIANNIAYDISVELEATNLINKIVLESLKDDKQFYRHLVQHETQSGDIHNGMDKRKWVESEQFDILDSKRLQAAAAALKVSAELKRLLTNIIDADKQVKLDMDKEKLELEKKNEKDTVINVIHNIPRAPVVTAEEPEEVLD